MSDHKIINDQVSTSGFLFREGRREDDAEIRALMKSISMPGPISLTADDDPSFFDAIEIEGHERHTIVVEADHRIVALGLVSKRRMFLNGTPADVGYISNLRADKSVRGRAIVTEFNRFVNQWQNMNFGVPFYLCAILKGNRKAREALAGGRINFAQIKEIGELYNAAIPLLKRPLPKAPAGVRVVRGNAVGATAIAEFLNRIGSKKQFYPVYTTEDIKADGGILRGLKPDDFHVALNGDHILGTIACWNQLPFRRMMVTGYSGFMRWLKPLTVPLTNLLRLAPIPDPGGPFRNAYAACIAIEDDHQDIFHLLLNTMLHSEYNTGKTFLTVSLMEADPLLSVVKKYLHFPLRTCIYAIYRDDLATIHQLDGRLPYIEAGGL